MELWTEMVMTMMMTTMVIIKVEMLTTITMRRIIHFHGTAGVHELYHGAMDRDGDVHDDSDDDNDDDNQSRDVDNDNNNNNNNDNNNERISRAPFHVKHAQLR